MLDILIIDIQISNYYFKIGQVIFVFYSMCLLAINDPPSTGIIVPVIYALALDDKNIEVPAMSSGTPILPRGTDFFICSPYSLREWAIILLWKGPGAIAFTLIFLLASLLANTLVNWCIAAFEAG